MIWWIIRDILMISFMNIKNRKISRDLNEIFLHGRIENERDLKMSYFAVIKKLLRPQTFMINKMYCMDMGVLSAVSKIFTKYIKKIIIYYYLYIFFNIFRQLPLLCQTSL
jgi:hypothetical protein